MLDGFFTYIMTYPREELSYILLVKQNQDSASKVLKDVVATYMTHDFINQNLVEVKEESAKAFEATFIGMGGKNVSVRIEAYGKGAAMRGAKWGNRRPDLIVIDDPQDYEDSISDTTLVKDFDRFMSDIKMLGRDSRIFLIGNNLGEKCLIERVMEHKAQLGFECMKIPALQENGEAAWAAQFSKEYLDQEKKDYMDVGKLDLWYRERMCVALPEESRTFKKEYIKYFEGDVQCDKYYITVDPAISMREGADNTAIVVTGVKDNKWYVTDLIAKKMNPSEIIDSLFSLYEQYRPVRIGIETVAYQQALSHFFHEEMRRRGVYPVVKELKHTNKKEERIRGMEPRFKVGDVFMRSWMTTLEEELLSFPKGKHDDCADSLSFLPEILDDVDEGGAVQAMNDYVLALQRERY